MSGKNSKIEIKVVEVTLTQIQQEDFICITQEGLLAVKKLLKKTVTENTAVACHKNKAGLNNLVLTSKQW